MKKFLKNNWRPIFWSGLGGLVFGGAYLAYKKGYVGNANPAVPLPEPAREIILQTEPVEMKLGVTRTRSGRNTTCRKRLSGFGASWRNARTATPSIM